MELKWRDSGDVFRDKIFNILIRVDQKTFLDQVEPAKEELYNEIESFFLDERLNEFSSESNKNIDTHKRLKLLKSWF